MGFSQLKIFSADIAHEILRTLLHMTTQDRSGCRPKLVLAMNIGKSALLEPGGKFWPVLNR